MILLNEDTCNMVRLVSYQGIPSYPKMYLINIQENTTIQRKKKLSRIRTKLRLKQQNFTYRHKYILICKI